MRRIPPVAVLAPLLLTLQAWPGVAEGWRFLRPRYEAGAWWELLSAQLVHLSAAHALANAGATVLLACLLGPGPGTGWQFGALAGGAAGVAFALALDPACQHYAGASGALHGLLAGAALRLAWWPPLGAAGTAATPSPGHRLPWRWGLLGLLLLKVACEAAGLWPSAWSFPVYWPAHAAGLGGGLLAVLVSGLARRPAAPAASDQQRQ